MHFLSGRKLLTCIKSLKNEYEDQPYEPKIDKIVFYSKNREPVNPHAIDANYLKLTEAEEKKLEEEKDDNESND